MGDFNTHTSIQVPLNDIIENDIYTHKLDPNELCFVISSIDTQVTTYGKHLLELGESNKLISSIGYLAFLILEGSLVFPIVVKLVWQTMFFILFLSFLPFLTTRSLITLLPSLTLCTIAYTSCYHTSYSTTSFLHFLPLSYYKL